MTAELRQPRDEDARARLLRVEWLLLELLESASPDPVTRLEIHDAFQLLEKRGHIQREPAKDDAMGVTYSLTASGLEFVSQRTVEAKR